jgi:hypothetical protein
VEGAEDEEMEWEITQKVKYIFGNCVKKKDFVLFQYK